MAAQLSVAGSWGTAVRVDPPPGVLDAWRFYAHGTPALVGHMQLSRRQFDIITLSVLEPGEYRGIVVEFRPLTTATAYTLAHHLARMVAAGALPVQLHPRYDTAGDYWEATARTILHLMDRYEVLQRPLERPDPAVLPTPQVESGYGPPAGRYRVGRSLGRTLYRVGPDGETCIGMVDTREDAALVVAALNAYAHEATP